MNGLPHIFIENSTLVRHYSHIDTLCVVTLKTNRKPIIFNTLCGKITITDTLRLMKFIFVHNIKKYVK